jgi:hypothetical protein
MVDDLRTAYSMKERAELLLSNLDKLKAEGTVTDAEYETLKPEYVAMLDDALPWIDSIKTELQRELAGKEKEFERLEKQISLLRARLKVGEITSETYGEKGKPLEEKVKQLEIRVSQLQTLIGATSSADIGGPKDISVPKPVAETKWKQYLKHFIGAISRLFSRLSKRVKVSKPVLFIIIILGIAVLITGLVVGTSLLHSAKIAFLPGTSAQPSIHLIDADGSNERMLAYSPSLAYNPPVWSPTGTKIACYYYTTLDPASEESLLSCKHGVIIMNEYGRNQKTIVFNKPVDY